jgi:hypothetical protein
LNMYNVGMPTLRRKPQQQNDPLFPTKSPLLHPLYFNRQDLNALKEVLESLSEPTLRIRPPALPEEGKTSATDSAPETKTEESAPTAEKPIPEK